MYDVLVTNDDGVTAPGILALARALKKVKNVKVTIVAPKYEMSSVSQAISLRTPIRIFKQKSNVYAVDGTTVDSVFAGVNIVLKKKPDFIFSGINSGGNLGDDVQYSGTVAGAIQGGLMGVPSVAMSLLGTHKFNYVQAADFAATLLKKLIKNPVDPFVVLNVNVPESISSKEVEITKTGKRDYGGKYDVRKDPRGRTYYWIGGDQYKYHSIKGSDCNATFNGKISITPIRVNRTETAKIKELKNWFNK